jgi:hypothetical protein
LRGGNRLRIAASPSPEHRPLHPLAWAGIIGGGLIGLATLVILSVQLGVLKDSQEHIRSQDAKVTALYNGARGALDDATPLARQAIPLARQARRTLSAVNASRGDLVDAADAVPRLLRITDALATAAIPLLRGLSAADAPEMVAATHTLVARVMATDLVGKAAAAADQMPDVIRIQQRLLRIQLATLRTQRATLEIQRQALTHIENLDRKTGGQLPPPPVPAVQP